MTLEAGKELNVVKARWAGGYSVDLDFSDGASKRVDFEPYLSASVHPDIRRYLDAERFKSFSVSFGNLVWDDYNLCFPIEDLYSGRLLAGKKPLGMVAEDAPEYGTQ